MESVLNGRIPHGSSGDKALRMLLESSWLHGNLILNRMNLRCLPFFGRDAVFPAQLELTREVLKPYASDSDPVMTDLLCALDGVIFREAMRGIFQRYLETAESYASFRADVEKLTGKLESLKERRKKFWLRTRHGIEPCETEEFDTSVQTLCRDLAEALNPKLLLPIRFALPVQYGAHKTAVFLLRNGTWHLLEEQVYKMTLFA